MLILIILLKIEVYLNLLMLEKTDYNVTHFLCLPGIYLSMDWN